MSQPKASSTFVPYSPKFAYQGNPASPYNKPIGFVKANQDIKQKVFDDWEKRPDGEAKYLEGIKLGFIKQSDFDKWKAQKTAIDIWNARPMSAQKARDGLKAGYITRDDYNNYMEKSSQISTFNNMEEGEAKYRYGLKYGFISVSDYNKYAKEKAAIDSWNSLPDNQAKADLGIKYGYITQTQYNNFVNTLKLNTISDNKERLKFALSTGLIDNKTYDGLMQRESMYDKFNAMTNIADKLNYGVAAGIITEQEAIDWIKDNSNRAVQVEKWNPDVNTFNSMPSNTKQQYIDKVEFGYKSGLITREQRAEYINSVQTEVFKPNTVEWMKSPLNQNWSVKQIQEYNRNQLIKDGIIQPVPTTGTGTGYIVLKPESVTTEQLARAGFGTSGVSIVPFDQKAARAIGLDQSGGGRIDPLSREAVKGFVDQGFTGLERLEAATVATTSAALKLSKDIEKTDFGSDSANWIRDRLYPSIAMNVAAGWASTATAIFRPYALVNTYKTFTDPTARGEFVEWIKANPYDFFYQTSGGIFGGRFVGQTMTPITEPLKGRALQLVKQLIDKGAPKIPGVRTVFYSLKYGKSKYTMPEFTVGDVDPSTITWIEGYGLSPAQLTQIKLVGVSLFKGGKYALKSGVDNTFVLASRLTDAGVTALLKQIAPTVPLSAFKYFISYLGVSKFNDLALFLTSIKAKLFLNSNGNIVIGGIKFMKGSPLTKDVIAKMLAKRYDVPVAITKDGTSMIIGGGNFPEGFNSKTVNELSKLVSDDPFDAIKFINSIDSRSYNLFIETNKTVWSRSTLPNKGVYSWDIPPVAAGKAGTEVAIAQQMTVNLIKNGVSPVSAAKLVTYIITDGVIAAVKYANQLKLKDVTISTIASSGLMLNTFGTTLEPTLLKMGVSKQDIRSLIPLLVYPEPQKLSTELPKLKGKEMELLLGVVGIDILSKTLDKFKEKDLIKVFNLTDSNTRAKLIDAAKAADLLAILPKVKFKMDEKLLFRTLQKLDEKQMEKLFLTMDIPDPLITKIRPHLPDSKKKVLDRVLRKMEGKVNKYKVEYNSVGETVIAKSFMEALNKTWDTDSEQSERITVIKL